MMHVLDPATIPVQRAATLVLFADRSTCTTMPATQDCAGLIQSADRIVVSNRHILWFNIVPGSLTITNGGAGMLRGIWSIGYDDEAKFFNI